MQASDYPLTLAKSFFHFSLVDNKEVRFYHRHWEFLRVLGQNPPLSARFLPALELGKSACRFRRVIMWLFIQRQTACDPLAPGFRARRACYNEGRSVLTTLHSSKGRQFDAVVLPGLVEGILPMCPWNRDTRSYGEPPPPVPSEDRRLFYVGFTRAWKAVFLIFGNSFTNDKGHAVALGASRFVKEIHKRLRSS